MPAKKSAARHTDTATAAVEARLREACLALPGTTETRSWGHPNFRAGKRIYVAFESIRGKPSIAFRLESQDVVRHLAMPGFFATPYGKGLWVSRDVSGRFSWKQVQQLIIRSHQLATASPASREFRLRNAVRRSPEIAAWFDAREGELGALASQWFGVMRNAGKDVREVLHDGCPVACIADLAFGYVNLFKAHVNVGFFNGAELDDPADLLEGSGKAMRHVKIWPFRDLDYDALRGLIDTAAANARARQGGAT